MPQRDGAKKSLEKESVKRDLARQPETDNGRDKKEAETERASDLMNKYRVKTR